LQRLCLRVENLGFLASFTRFAVVAKISSLLLAAPSQLKTQILPYPSPRPIA